MPLLEQEKKAKDSGTCTQVIPCKLPIQHLTNRIKKTCTYCK